VIFAVGACLRDAIPSVSAEKYIVTVEMNSQFMYPNGTMNTLRRISFQYLPLAILVVVALIATGSLLAGQPQAASSGGNRLIVYGDTVFFIAPGVPMSCTHSNYFKRGDNIGFRMTAIDAATGKRDRTAQLVVHLTYAGKTVDVPMRDRQTERQPEREFWVGKWPVPADAPLGIVRYTVTAKTPSGLTGEYKPFEVQESQLIIVP
jgi:hypothetical protein